MNPAASLSTFDLVLTSLSNGEHRMHYRLDGDFFGLFETSLIQKAAVEVECVLNRLGNRLDCRVRSQGTISLTCDRCLEGLDWPIQDDSALVVQLTENPAESTDEILYLPMGETRLNLAQFFYENIHLHLPMRAVCEDASLLCQAPAGFDSHEQPNTASTSTDEAPVDPRWEQLKQINFS
ncbi:MAG: YceD family protein [Bacteroidota bacterium]